MKMNSLSMNRGIWMMLGLLTAVSVPVMAKDAGAEKKASLHVVLEMSDGSRLVGTPAEKALRVNTEYMKVEIPLVKIRQCEIRHQEERIILTLQNGDKLTGILETHQFRLGTSSGKLAPEFAQIDRMTFTTAPPKQFEVQGRKVAHGWEGSHWTSSEIAAPDSVEGKLRSQGKRWVRTGGITVGAYVQDIFEGRLDQPKGRGAIGKVVSLSKGGDGKPVAMVDFGRGYTVGIFLSELCLVSIVPEDKKAAAKWMGEAQ
jgi:hypothetical protein